jgi:hypothetical protein
MLTRQQAQDALTHVLQALLGFIDTNPLPLALVCSGYTDIHHVITMTQDDIDALEYEDGNQNVVGMPSPARNLLRIFNAYHVFQYEEGDPIGDGWTSIMPQEFNEFRVGVYTIIINPSPAGYARQWASATSMLSTTPCLRDPVADFQKGIKCDPTLFLDFKIKQQWVLSWQRSTLAQAQVQDIADVLDPAYAHRRLKTSSSSKRNRSILYAVFEQKLQTDKGNALVREYEVTSDAQAVYAALLDHYTKSVKALLNQSQLMVYITTIKIGNGSWCGSAASFVLNWQDKVHEFEKLSDAKNHFSDEWKKLIMLQNAVHPLAELHQVKLTADQNKVTGVALTYDNYFKLLYSATVNYNKSFSVLQWWWCTSSWMP